MENKSLLINAKFVILSPNNIERRYVRVQKKYRLSF